MTVAVRNTAAKPAAANPGAPGSALGGALERGLDRLAAAGRTAAFWWRDDDAVAPSAALDRLLAVRGTAPLALAVIPAAAGPALAARLAPEAGVVVLQHGYAHRNHAPAGAKKCELGPPRPADAVLAELAAGRQRLQRLFGGRALPVLVPPWNRIDPALLPALAAQGFRGISGYRQRPTAAQAADAGLALGNAAVDIVDWPAQRAGGAALAGTAAAALAERLAAGRPIGLLTHHLVHDDACWAFLAALVALLDGHPGARWLAPAAVFDRARVAAAAVR